MHSSWQTDGCTDKPKPICPVNFFKVGGIIKEHSSSWKKYNEGQHAGPRVVMTTSQVSLPWSIALVGEPLKKDRQICICAFFTKVAVPLPDYIQPSNRVSRYCHSMTFHQLQSCRDYWKYSFLCPQLRRSWRGILVSGCVCVHASVHAFIRTSRTVHDRVLKFHIWIPHGKIADIQVVFFLSELSPFLELYPFDKIRMKSDAGHILRTMLGFWNFIYGFLMEKSWPVFFSCPCCLPFWNYAPLKK